MIKVRHFIILVVLLVITIGYVPANAKKSDFKIKDNILLKYNGTDKKVIIPDGIVEIGDSAFYDEEDSGAYEFVEEIILPNSLKKIGGHAFCNCKNLKVIMLPSDLVEIGEYAFCNTGLTEIVFPEDIKKIGQGAFNGTKIKHFNIPSSLVEIDGPLDTRMYSYQDGNGVVTYDISKDNPKFYTESGFLYSRYADDFDYNITGNGTNFNYYGQEKTVRVPEGIINIFNIASGSVTEELILSDTVELIEYNSIRGYGVKRIEIGENLKSVNSCAFITATKLEEFTVSEGKKLKYAKVHDGLLELYDWMWVPASYKKETLVIPSHIKKVYCDGLYETVTSNGKKYKLFAANSIKKIIYEEEPEYTTNVLNAPLLETVEVKNPTDTFWAEDGIPYIKLSDGIVYIFSYPQNKRGDVYFAASGLNFGKAVQRSINNENFDLEYVYAFGDINQDALTSLSSSPVNIIVDKDYKKDNSAFVKEGYTFGGLYLDEKLTTPIVTFSEKELAGKVAFIKWIPIAENAKNEITLDTSLGGQYKTKKKINYYSAPDKKSKTSKTVKKNKKLAVIGIVKDENGECWAYTTGQKWVMFDDLKSVKSTCIHKKYITKTLPDGKYTDVCKKCGREYDYSGHSDYSAGGYYTVIKQDTEICSFYNKATAKEALSVGKKVRISSVVTTPQGKKWYKLEDDAGYIDTTCLIKSDATAQEMNGFFFLNYDMWRELSDDEGLKFGVLNYYDVSTNNYIYTYNSSEYNTEDIFEVTIFHEEEDELWGNFYISMENDAAIHYLGTVGPYSWHSFFITRGKYTIYADFGKYKKEVGIDITKDINISTTPTDFGGNRLPENESTTGLTYEDEYYSRYAMYTVKDTF